jgi:hypothetical protein
MAARNGRTTADVRRELEAEREQLADALDELRAGLAKLRSKLPLVAAGALGAGFFLAGGVGATIRLLARKSPAGTTRAKVGPFSLVDRD